MTTVIKIYMLFSTAFLFVPKHICKRDIQYKVYINQVYIDIKIY
jgi:hypothetical protein